MKLSNLQKDIIERCKNTTIGFWDIDSISRPKCCIFYSHNFKNIDGEPHPIFFIYDHTIVFFDIVVLKKTNRASGDWIEEKDFDKYLRVAIKNEKLSNFR